MMTLKQKYGNWWLAWGKLTLEMKLKSRRFRERYQHDLELIGDLDANRVAAAALYWKFKTEAYFDYLALGWPVLGVRYEDLVRQPQEQIRRITDFLGLEWEDSLLNHHQQQHQELDEQGKAVGETDPQRAIDARSLRRYESLLSPQEVAAILQVAGDLNERLASEPLPEPSPPSGLSPSIPAQGLGQHLAQMEAQDLAEAVAATLDWLSQQELAFLLARERLEALESSATQAEDAPSAAAESMPSAPASATPTSDEAAEDGAEAGRRNGASAADPKGEAAMVPRHERHPPRPVASRPRRGVDFRLYTSSKGNYFFGEIRDLIAAGLRELGYRVEIGDETRGFSPDSGWHIVVAPHEFFYLGAGAALRGDKLPQNLILVNTEQPSTHWFAMSASLFYRAAHIWDINHWSAQQIREKGFEVGYLPLGYVPGFHLYREVRELPHHYGTCFLEGRVRRRSYLNQPLAQRPIDLLFVGGLTPRREAFFARSAPVFSRYQTYFHLSDSRRPVIPGLSTYMNTETVVGLAQRSKIFLNLHRDKDRYFEWHRVVLLGIWQKALVISESSQPAPPFQANVDYVETSLQEMPELVEYYLSSPEGQRMAQEIVEHGYRTLTQQCRMVDALRPLLEAVNP
jgi:hypothetical protein